MPQINDMHIVYIIEFTIDPKITRDGKNSGWLFILFSNHISMFSCKLTSGR